jgi:hypothetical protein
MKYLCELSDFVVKNMANVIGHLQEKEQINHCPCKLNLIVAYT